MILVLVPVREFKCDGCGQVFMSANPPIDHREMPVLGEELVELCGDCYDVFMEKVYPLEVKGSAGV